MDGTFRSENILGGLADDYLTLSPFGPSVPADGVALVNAKKPEFMAGKTHVFAGPPKDNTSRCWTGTSPPWTRARSPAGAPI
jgi:basic membrane protein A and related proteins